MFEQQKNPFYSILIQFFGSLNVQFNCMRIKEMKLKWNGSDWLRTLGRH